MRYTAVIVLCVGLCACGQKGPLYLPDDSTPVLVAPAPSQPAAASSDTERAGEPAAERSKPPK